jgi:hypothetical protein
MTPLMFFGSLVLIPAAVAVLLRINAAVLFMSLCVGEVLVQYVASSAGTFQATVGGHSGSVSQSTLRLALLLAPPILTAIFMFHSVHGSAKLILNIFPAIGVGLLTALLVKPLLSASFQHTLEQSSLWHQFSKAQAVVVSVSALFSLLFLWLQRHGSSGSGHHGAKHHG